MLKKILNDRDLPELLQREAMLDILQKEEYGYLPPKPDSLSYEVEENIIQNFCAGKAILNKVTITAELFGKKFSWFIHSVVPTKKEKHPFFVHIGLEREVPNKYLPVEELVDNGFGILFLCCRNVTEDNGDFTDGLAGVLFESGKREPSSPGKIAMWAWAMHRMLDYAETVPEFDMTKAVSVGHSRLGKTALFAGATDTRFSFVHSNNSGCSGAALTRGKGGENIEKICEQFDYWFCPNYRKYINNEDKLPFDQHWLLALVAPRYLSVASAAEDYWSDTDSEFLACVAASVAYEKLGLTGFVHNNRLPEVGECYFDGAIGYQIRPGLHYFSRQDYLRLIEFIYQKAERK